MTTTHDAPQSAGQINAPRSAGQFNAPRSAVALDTLNLQLPEAYQHWNLTPPELYEHILKNDEGVLTDKHAIRIVTGTYTGRSPKDRFIVEDEQTKERVDWGGFNTPISKEVFEKLHAKVASYLKDKSVYVKDLYAGADPEHRLNVRVVSEVAYHGLFSHNMFIRPSDDELASFTPNFTVLAAPFCEADPETDGTQSKTFILVNFEKKLILIGGTLYSGEVKKGIFGVMNYLLPQKGVMPMHCSANVDSNGNTAVFFGLSGTGKTTLSADQDKTLVGDDEHGWSDQGIFNFEGGCYAKTINLSPKQEPEIYATTQMPGTILENVILDHKRRPDFDDVSLTQNTRCSYPIDYIPNASKTGRAGHPKNIIFLTADAFGVLPPISRLSPAQAMYHFMSGYTAKVAGTERGITEPEATFSACFGAPFMPLHPSEYARLLAEKIKKHNATVWLINTGWTGGSYGVGSRMKLSSTRTMLAEALSGSLNKGAFHIDPIFGLEIPDDVPGVQRELLDPKRTWPNKDDYTQTAVKLAGMFRENFKQFEEVAGEEIASAGPLV
ncbi:MAG: phosphoenolpyruvate carboxykinase (ATP) [Balneolaceae bacterium]|nr:phosphoenolpyruvate carboxykinase (ATP) [Balneolaceae bacterium]MDR9447002.1 phosphoenolpyruvate carboxykinase (ATP) [Balneolaceae bacterium]